MNSDDVIARSNQLYDQAARTGTDRFARVLSNDWRRQYYRFAEILRFMDGLDRRETSVLDVGCGNGELLNVLNFNGFVGRYQGIDINEPLLAEARRAFPSADFRRADILKEEVGPADFVVLSGAFNFNVGQDHDWLFAFVHRMAKAARRRVIFNAVSTYVNFREDSMFYVDPAALIGYVAGRISRRFELRHHFIPCNFTFCIHTEEDWHSLDEFKAADG